MAHGINCDCMICAVGKKMGMIHHDKHDDHDSRKERHDVCENCHHAHKEDGHCDCGCK